jgi:copper chaperone
MHGTIKIDGMSCEHCVKAVTGAVSGVDGVSNVAVKIGQADFDYSGNAADLQKIKDAINDQGFEAQ